MSDDDFDWDKSDAIVIRSYGSVAVYTNPAGDLVFRQERGPLDSEDQWVIIPIGEVEAIIVAMRKAVAGE